MPGRLFDMAASDPQDRTYVTVRSRVFVCLVLAPILTIALAVVISATTNSQPDYAIAFIPCLCIGLAIVARALYGFKIVVSTDRLTYRAMWRTYGYPKSLMLSASLDKGKSTSGISNMMIANLHLRDGNTVPLKLFCCFRPTPEAPSPIGYRLLQDMTSDINKWVGHVDLADLPPPVVDNR
jgi:hypothetical protein